VYIMQLLALKALTGILDASDLNQVNSWLERSSTAINNETTAPIKQFGKKSIRKKARKKINHEDVTANTDANKEKIVVIDTQQIESAESAKPPISSGNIATAQ
jgi:hypothetical protein